VHVHAVRHQAPYRPGDPLNELVVPLSGAAGEFVPLAIRVQADADDSQSPPLGSSLQIREALLEIRAGLGNRGAHAGDDLNSRFEEFVLDLGVLPAEWCREFIDDFAGGTDQLTGLQVHESKFEFHTEARRGRRVECQGHTCRVGRRARLRGVFADAVVAEGGPGSTAVAAGSSQAAATAAAILQLGGNAIDAVTAAGFATPMCEPVLSSLAGGGFCLYAPANAEPKLLDFFVDVPGLGGMPDSPMVETVTVKFGNTAEQVFHAGWGTVATPGCFAGYLDMHRRWGRLPLAEVLAPAIELAASGLHLDPIQIRFLDVVAPILELTEHSASIFTSHDGLFTNHEYLRLLTDLAQGDIEGAYDSAYISSVSNAVRKGGGVLSSEDMRNYRPMLRDPLRTTHSGAQVWTNPPPSFGGSIVSDALDRIARAQSSSWETVVDALEDATSAQRKVTDVTEGTTHISVLDASGGMAALSVSNGAGSGTVVDGIQLNNMLGEEDLNTAIQTSGIGAIHELQPGTRMGSMMAPTITELRDGSRIALGTGGSERIRSAVTTTLTRVIDLRMALDDAVAAPRLHVANGQVDLEPGLLQFRRIPEFAGRPARVWPARDLYFGGVHAVMKRKDGSVLAVGDPRRGGSVAVD